MAGLGTVKHTNSWVRLYYVHTYLEEESSSQKIPYWFSFDFETEIFDIKKYLPIRV